MRRGGSPRHPRTSATSAAISWFGNHGDGEITAYEAAAGGAFELAGQLRGARGGPLSIDGLWGLGFGNGITTGPANTLFFTAGPGDESHGLLGSITAD